jgi:hypothetical protein
MSDTKRSRWPEVSFAPFASRLMSLGLPAPISNHAFDAPFPRIPEEDYFRRAPRANELFLLFNKAGVRAVIQEFIAHYNAAQSKRAAQ